MKRIAAVVVTYNRRTLLKENIECLLAQKTTEQLDIIIIDNASTDNTREYISEFIDKDMIIYINTGSNLGGAGGFQYGIRYAAENSYDYVWVMDDDCMPKESALDAFIHADSELEGRYGFLASKVLWKDGNICRMNIQRETLTRPVADFSSQYIPVVMSSFVSLFIPVPVVRDLGLPIKEFFIWTDDWEYTRRISKKYKCYLITGSIVTHKSASNIGANVATDTADRLERYKYLYRNDVYLYRREGIHGFIYEALRLMTHIFRVIVKSKNNRIRRIGCIIGGTIDGFTFRPEIEYVE